MDINTILTLAVGLTVIAAIMLTRKKSDAGGNSVPDDYEDIKRKLAVAKSEIDAKTEAASKLEEKIEKLEEANRKFVENNSRLETSWKIADQQKNRAEEETKLAQKEAGEKQDKIDELKNEISKLHAKIAGLSTELKASEENLKTQMNTFEKMRKEAENQFKVLADEILKEKSKDFSEGGKKVFDDIVNPLKEQIEKFKKRVDEVHSESEKSATALKTTINMIAEQSNKMSEKAENLTLALRGDKKAQGDWGEYILRNLLEESGLREIEQFTFQETFTSEDGKSLRTDVIVKMPNFRFLVIDSKVSLNAYTDYVGATDKTSRDTALKQHLTDIRNNVTRLSEAGYNRLPNRNTPDFVVMFVPNEPALFTALQNDSKLWQDAYKQNILLVGPTTLLSIIRIVNMLWVEERQMQNVKAVMERGAKLYDKFNGFINDMEDIGKNLAKAGESYDAAFSKLKTGQGSLIRQTEMMRKLGVPSKNRISSRFLEDAGIETAEEVEEDD